MSNQLKTRNGIPFDFVDGLRIKGADVTNWDKVFTDQGASYVGFKPAGNITASNVQAAIEELDSEKLAKVDLATQSVNGAMSATDKTKLDNLATSGIVKTATQLRPGANQGIVWDNDAFGGSMDTASITLEAPSGEATKMRFKMTNDSDDNFEFTATSTDGLSLYNNAMTLNGNVILNSANYADYVAGLSAIQGLVSKSDLGAETGASMVGYGNGGTVKSRLDDITGADGAGLVGYTPEDMGALPTTVKARLNAHDAALKNVEGNLNFDTLPAASTPIDNANLLLIRQGAANAKVAVSTLRAEIATEAVAAASRANDAKVAAEAARDAAQLSVGVYSSTTNGLAATTSGRYFSVPSPQSTEYLILYFNSSGTAVEQGRYPSTNGVDMYRGTVAGLGYDNFNQLVLRGWYYSTNTACFNTPYGTTYVTGMITFRSTGPDLAIQTYYKDGLLSEIWSRSFVPSTSTWSSWTRQTSPTELIPASRTSDNFPYREDLSARVAVTDRDCNKALLPGFYAAGGVNAVLNTPFGTSYTAGTLVVSKRKTDHVQIFYINDSPDDYAIRTFTDTATFTAWSRRTNRNAGKKWVSLGDSITQGQGAGTDGPYSKIAAKYLDGVILTNLGYSGGSMAYRSNQSAAINDKFFARITAGTAMAGFDLITVAYGTNDAGNIVPIGALGSTDETTFYGSMAVGYANIISANPAARVVFILPTYRHPETGLLQTYRDAIVAFCQSKNLIYLEPNKHLGWNADNQATFLGDTLHPNATGYEAYGRYVAGRLSSVW